MDKTTARKLSNRVHEKTNRENKMKVVIFPPPGYEGAEKFYKECENNWHILHIELKKQLEESGYEVFVFPCEVDVKADTGIYFEHQPIVPLTKRSLLIMLEPPVVRPRQYEVVHGLPYTRVLSYARDICDDKRIFFSPFPVPSYTKDLSHIKRDKYICAISSYFPSTTAAYNHPDALYKAREQMYISFGKDLDLYGHRWWEWEFVSHVNYLGTVQDKVAKLAEYRYSIVFENCVLLGFNSEKYYNCWQAKTAAIYRGAKDLVLPLEEVTEVPWAKRVVQHVKEVA